MPEIDMIYCPDHYSFTPVHKLSADPRPVFKKSGITIIREQAAEKTAAVVENTRVLQPEMMLVPANR